MQKVKAWGDLTIAKVLIIGHDPRLRKSDTFAEYCFFADYFFRKKPEKHTAEYQLAESLFSYITPTTNTMQINFTLPIYAMFSCLMPQKIKRCILQKKRRVTEFLK